MIYKERMSYYDMDPHTAQLYAPIDKYLKQTKRFSQKVMKKKYALGIAGFVIGLMILLGNIIRVLTLGGWGTALGLGVVAAILVAVMIYFIRHYGEKPHMDMLTCEDVLDNDGIERVYRDYSQAREFSPKVVLGREYLFIKGHTIVRLGSIVNMKIHVVTGDESDSYFFKIQVNDDAFGNRFYILDRLSNSTQERELEFAEKKSILESAQKRIEQIDI